MKKLLALILALLMLCSCAANGPVQEPQNEPEIEIVDEVSYTDENGKYGFHKDGVPVTEAVYDEILQVNKIEGRYIYVASDETADGIYAGIITDGTRKDIEMNWEQGTHYVDVPNVLYWLYESGNDSLINETPLWNFTLLPPGDMGNSTLLYLIRGSYAGDSYTYSGNGDGTWELYEKQSGGVYNTYINFRMTRYYWSWRDERFGTEDFDGNTLIEPIYYIGEYNVNGKLIVHDGSPRTTADDVIRTYIVDSGGNIISDEYSYIARYIPETGKFILIASKLGDDGYYHWWFIDDDGNKLSEEFDYIIPIYGYYEDMFGGPYWYRTAKVAKDGVETEISVLDYALDYE